MGLLSLCKRIKSRPERFIGSHDIFALRHFLAGYAMAIEETDHSQADRADWLFSDFTRFLPQKYHDIRVLDWTSLIAAHEPDGTAQRRFSDAFTNFWLCLKHNSNLLSPRGTHDLSQPFGFSTFFTRRLNSRVR